MKNMKLQLANNILVEIEAIKECTDLKGGLLLAELMTQDAKKLAELIRNEEKESMAS